MDEDHYDNASSSQHYVVNHGNTCNDNVYSVDLNNMFLLVNHCLRNVDGYGMLLGSHLPTATGTQTECTDILAQTYPGAFQSAVKTLLLNRAKDQSTDCSIVGMFYSAGCGPQSQMIRHLVDIARDRCTELEQVSPIAIIIRPQLVQSGIREGIECFRLTQNILDKINGADNKKIKISDDELSIEPVKLEIESDVNQSLFLEEWSLLDSTVRQSRYNCYESLNGPNDATVATMLQSVNHSLKTLINTETSDGDNVQWNRLVAKDLLSHQMNTFNSDFRIDSTDQYNLIDALLD